MLEPPDFASGSCPKQTSSRAASFNAVAAQTSKGKTIIKTANTKAVSESASSRAALSKAVVSQAAKVKTINQTVSAKAKAASSRAASSSASSSNASSSTNLGSVGYAITKQQMQAKVADDFSWKPVLRPSYDFETWFFHLKEHVNNLECTADIVDGGLSNLRKWLQETDKPFVLKLLEIEFVKTKAKHKHVKVFFPPTRGDWICPARPGPCLIKRVYFHGGALSHLFSILSKGFCPAWVGTGGFESDGVCLSELPGCASGYPCRMHGGEWVASNCGIALRVIYHVISLSETGGKPDSQKLLRIRAQGANRQWASLDSTDLQIVAIEFIPQAQAHHLDEDFVNVASFVKGSDWGGDWHTCKTQDTVQLP